MAGRASGHGFDVARRAVLPALSRSIFGFRGRIRCCAQNAAMRKMPQMWKRIGL